ncbi:hypothetical protein [Leptospira barantonii]|uniref:SH3 domain-containing protein n=1 Tax=Leptospira barantonii TaxID=2023184 RepID=A0ABX4NK31_9LEPT|nr:hypothetical protein [Leptospira barantonii]PJZ57159.1 hypothetical protein CH367_10425 [Leptospira barantonii]
MRLIIVVIFIGLYVRPSFGESINGNFFNNKSYILISNDSKIDLYREPNYDTKITSAKITKKIHKINRYFVPIIPNEKYTPTELCWFQILNKGTLVWIEGKHVFGSDLKLITTKEAYSLIENIWIEAGYEAPPKDEQLKIPFMKFSVTNNLIKFYNYDPDDYETFSMEDMKLECEGNVCYLGNLDADWIKGSLVIGFINPTEIVIMGTPLIKDISHETGKEVMRGVSWKGKIYYLYKP